MNACGYGAYAAREVCQLNATARFILLTHDLANTSPNSYEMFENQRYVPVNGWGNSYPGHLLPTDRAKYSDEGGWKKIK